MSDQESAPCDNVHGTCFCLPGYTGASCESGRTICRHHPLFLSYGTKVALLLSLSNSLLLQNALTVSMDRIAWSNVSVRMVLRATSSPACVTAPSDGQERSVA